MTALYSNRLLEITDDEVVFHGDYFPVAGNRYLPWSRIGSVSVRRSSALGGRWRIWGSGDFRTGFPWDPLRPRRDRIFVASVRGGYWKSGFTTEDSARVAEILCDRGLLVEEVASFQGQYTE